MREYDMRLVIDNIYLITYKWIDPCTQHVKLLIGQYMLLNNTFQNLCDMLHTRSVYRLVSPHKAYKSALKSTSNISMQLSNLFIKFIELEKLVDLSKADAKEAMINKLKCKKATTLDQIKLVYKREYQAFRNTYYLICTTYHEFNRQLSICFKVDLMEE